jgi:hypothetical protein
MVIKGFHAAADDVQVGGFQPVGVRLSDFELGFAELGECLVRVWHYVHNAPGIDCRTPRRGGQPYSVRQCAARGLAVGVSGG